MNKKVRVKILKGYRDLLIECKKLQIINIIDKEVESKFETEYIGPAKVKKIGSLYK